MKQAIRRAVRAVLRAWPVWVIPGVVMALAMAAVADLYGGGGNVPDGGRRESPEGTAGGPTPVAPITANPNGTANANAVLDYLMTLPNRADDRILAGQHAGGGDDASFAPFESIYGDTGHWVGLLSADYAFSADYTRVNSLAKRYWSEGGLVTLSYHMPNVWTGGNFYDRSGIDISQILAPGAPERERWLSELDFVAEALGDLRDSGVVVLWRPLHEMNGTWFWWGGKPPGQFQALWRDMFDYLTYEKGLDNLLWVYSPSASQGNTLLRYPGPQYVDIVGLDVYSKLERDCTTFTGYSELITLGKPFAFTEFGPGVGGEENVEPYDWEDLMGCIRSAHPETIYFMVWRGNFGLDSDLHRGVDALLEDPWIVNRSEVAWRLETPSPSPSEPSTYTDSPIT
ncbi:MAG: glycosyl hydrolase [Actinomycetota bacterium]